MAKKEKKADEKRPHTGKSDKRKLIPPVIMLTAGAMAGILLARGEYELHILLLIWFLVLLGFYVLGCILKYALDRFDRQNAPQEPDEGEVIEKEPEESESEAEVTNTAEG